MSLTSISPAPSNRRNSPKPYLNTSTRDAGSHILMPARRPTRASHDIKKLDITSLERALLDQSAEMLLAVDPASLLIVAANQRAADLLGYLTKP